MPILTLSIHRYGPVIEVVLSESEIRAAERRKARLPAMVPRLCSALVDTGSSRTFLDRTVIDALGLDPSGTTIVNSATSGTNPETSLLFGVQVTITVGGKSMSTVLEAGEIDLSRLGVDVILGRDILAKCLLIYNGPKGEYTLSF